jgi:hypothetical protein
LADDAAGSECDRSASANERASYVECRRGWLLMAVALDVADDEDDSGEVRRLTAPVPPPPVLDDSEDDDDELMTATQGLPRFLIPWK